MLLTDLPGLNAIRCGALFHKSKDIGKYLAQSTRTVILEYDGYTDHLAHKGSCTLLKYHDKYYIVCTRHQFGIQPGDIPCKKTLETIRFASILDKDKLSNIPIKSCVFVSNNPDEEFNDIIVFIVEETWVDLIREEPYFFQIDSYHNGGERHLSYFFGCPSLPEVMEYDPPTVNIKTYLSDCNLDKNFKSNNKYYRLYRYEERGAGCRRT
jgi:hypothetical protein